MKQIFFAALLLIVGTAAHAAPKCAPVSLAVSGGSKAFVKTFAPKSSKFKTLSANWAKAQSGACAAGLLKKNPLPARLLLLNAPEANIASIYKSGGRMVLEYSFMASDGSVNLPSAEDLQEAIFCSVRGATEKEQEESGRCLPD